MSGYNGYDENQSGGRRLGMKWYKFLVGWELWIEIIRYFITAFLYGVGTKLLTGATIVDYQGIALKIRLVNILYAFGCAGISLLLFISRQGLKKYKSYSISLLHLSYIAICGMKILCAILYCIIGGTIKMIDGDLLANITFDGILLLYNINYFRKREHLFVN